MQFGVWTAGARLGGGEFGEVFEATPPAGSKDAAKEWAVKVAPLQRKGGKKSKSTQSQAAIGLAVERRLYQTELRGCTNVPALPASGAYGDTEGQRYLVLQRLGETLTQRADAAGGSLPPSAVAHVGVEVMKALQQAHNRKYVYVDMKSDNIMCGAGRDSDRVFLVDWGCAYKFKTASGGFLDKAVDAGNDTHRSLPATRGEPAAPRDDLESLGYVLLRLATGALPWLSTKSQSAMETMKATLSTKAMCKGAPAFIEAFLSATRALPLTDAAGIDYDGLMSILTPHVGAKPFSGRAMAGAGRAARGGSHTRKADKENATKPLRGRAKKADAEPAAEEPRARGRGGAAATAEPLSVRRSRRGSTTSADSEPPAAAPRRARRGSSASKEPEPQPVAPQRTRRSSASKEPEPPAAAPRRARRGSSASQEPEPQPVAPHSRRRLPKVPEEVVEDDVEPQAPQKTTKTRAPPPKPASRKRAAAAAVDAAAGDAEQPAPKRRSSRHMPERSALSPWATAGMVVGVAAEVVALTYPFLS